jgi:hypothetical protein
MGKESSGFGYCVSIAVGRSKSLGKRRSDNANGVASFSPGYRTREATLVWHETDGNGKTDPDSARGMTCQYQGLTQD